MRTDLFDFDLPPERIALRPVAPRDAARLLVVRPGGDPELEDRGVRDLPDLLSRPTGRDGGGEGRGRRGDAVVLLPWPGARSGHCGARRHAAAALHRLE